MKTKKDDYVYQLGVLLGVLGLSKLLSNDVRLGWEG